VAAPTGSRHGRDRRRSGDPILWWYAVVVGLAGLQVLVLDGMDGVVGGLLPYVAAGAVVWSSAWVTGGAAPDAEAAATRWVRGIAAVGALLAVWTVVTFAVALPDGLGDPSGFYRVKVQVTTPAGDHNTAAGVLLVGLVAASLATLRDRRWSPALVVVAAGLIATLSRGAAVVAVLVAVAVTLPTASRRVGRLLLVAAAAIMTGIVALAAWLGAAPPPGAAVPDGPIGTSVVGRADLAVRGLELGLDHPLLGVGLGRFQAYATDLPPPNDHAHQLLTHAFAEGGLVLLVVSIALPVGLVLRARRWTTGDLRVLILAGGGALVLHAQAEILGGRVGYEVSLACLLAATWTAGRSAHGGRGRSSHAGSIGTRKAPEQRW
jgi:hypothetical protein